LVTAFVSPPALPRVLTLPGVYAPQADSRLLAAALAGEDIRPGTRVLDLCTGSGVLAVSAARRGADVTAVDAVRKAVLTARLNAFLARRRVRVRHGDLTDDLPHDAFDIVTCNPPYVPSPTGALPRTGPETAWDAGHDGRALLDRICVSVPALLRRNGVLLMVHSGLCDADTTVRMLTDAGLRTRVAQRAYVPFGPVLRTRLAWLRERGLVDTHDEHEELVVIRAEKR